MKIKKVVLTSVAALSLFATSAATATSSMTPVVSNASVHKVARHHKGHKRVRKSHKRAKKYSFKFNWLIKVTSKGHKTFYYNTVSKSPKMTLHQARTNGWHFNADSEPGYKVLHRATNYVIGMHNKHVYALAPWHVTTFVNRKHKAIKNSEFTGQGTHRVSKAHFNRMYHSLKNLKIKGTY